MHINIKLVIIFIFRSGETREGSWVSDRLVGIVTFFREDGTVHEEVWAAVEDAEEDLVKMGDMDTHVPADSPGLHIGPKPNELSAFPIDMSRAIAGKALRGSA